MLEKIMDGNLEAARLLAIEVHGKICDDVTGPLPESDKILDLSNIGIWIDPIDATAQYIKGKEIASNYDCKFI